MVIWTKASFIHLKEHCCWWSSRTQGLTVWYVDDEFVMVAGYLFSAILLARLETNVFDSKLHISYMLSKFCIRLVRLTTLSFNDLWLSGIGSIWKLLSWRIGKFRISSINPLESCDDERNDYEVSSVFLNINILTILFCVFRYLNSKLN